MFIWIPRKPVENADSDWMDLGWGWEPAYLTRSQVIQTLLLWGLHGVQQDSETGFNVHRNTEPLLHISNFAEPLALCVHSVLVITAKRQLGLLSLLYCQRSCLSEGLSHLFKSHRHFSPVSRNFFFFLIIENQKNAIPEPLNFSLNLNSFYRNPVTTYWPRESFNHYSHPERKEEAVFSVCLVTTLDAFKELAFMIESGHREVHQIPEASVFNANVWCNILVR